MATKKKNAKTASLRARVLADVGVRFADVTTDEIVVFVVGREDGRPYVLHAAELGCAGGMPEMSILLAVADDAARELRRARVEGAIDDKIDALATAVTDKVSGMLGQFLRR